MVRGELPHKKFYLIPNVASPQLGAGDINVVSPTQQAVEQAKIAVKRKLERIPHQVGGKKLKTSKKKKTPKLVFKKFKPKPQKSVKKTIKRLPKKKKPQSKSKRSRVKTSNKLKYF